MVFCGQCGLQLAPGDTRCSRCGTVIEAEAPMTGGVSYPNNPTVEAQSFIAQHPPQFNTQGAAGPFIPNEQQQPLVLRSGPDGSGYNGAAASDATSMMGKPFIPNAYPGATQQGRGNFPTRGTSYPTMTQQARGYQPVGTGYSGFVPANNAYYPATGQYLPGQVQAAQHSKGRATALIIILFGLLMILTSLVLLILQNNGVI